MDSLGSFITSFLLALDVFATSDFPIVNLVIVLTGAFSSSLRCPKASLFRVREFTAFNLELAFFALGVDCNFSQTGVLESSEIVALESLPVSFEIASTFCEKDNSLVGGEGTT